MIYLVLACLLLIIVTGIAPQWSILLGLIIALSFKPAAEIQQKAKAYSARILQWSVVLLGASLNFHSVVKQGGQGIIITLISITSVMVLGHILALAFKVTSPLSVLISAGTSICGGSAISAVSPVLKADTTSMAMAVGIVFILNALSVFIFPPFGQFLNLSQEQFGTWAALAIHDTSSVVAASQIYGEEALKVGTTLKLTRALWIIPLTLMIATLKRSEGKITIPWFIFFFLGLSLLFTFIDSLRSLIPYTGKISKIGFSSTLFLIGLTLDKQKIAQLGLRPILFGITLWIITLSGSLYYVKSFMD